MEYNDIIKAVKCCKMPPLTGACKNCPLRDTENCTSELLNSILNLLDRLNAENKTLLEKKCIKWIPVSERLPEAEKEVLAMCRTSTGGKYFCTAIYIPKGMLRDDSWFNWDYEICEEYSEENDDYFVPEGWYERYYNYDEYGCGRIEDTVTHWAETVPEPAEEKKND